MASQGATMVNLQDYEQYAQDNLPRNASNYYHSGANDMITLRANRSIYAEYCLMARVLRDVSKVTLETTLLGAKISFPVCIAPWAMQRMAHPDGELATARAAARMQTCMTLSSVSTTPLEDVAQAGRSVAIAPLWFQLYVYKDRNITTKLVRRAVKSGYTAIVLTVDTPTLGRREADVRNRFSLPPHLTLGNFIGPEYAAATAGPAPSSTTTASKEKTEPESALASYFVQQIDSSLTWDTTIPFLRSLLPSDGSVKLIIKGVLTAEDAVKGAQYGVDAIWVSNHGARQLDTSPATLEVLEEITEAVRTSPVLSPEARNVEIYLDGGITRGTDVIKALALGARAVFLGRPIMWGLTHNGEDGVYRVLELLKDEITLAMKLLGCTSVQVTPPFNATL